MRKSFRCAHCRTENLFTTYTLKAPGNVNQLCTLCGASTSCNARGEGHTISPAMLPLSAPGRASPWRGHEYVPVNRGEYECEFRGLPHILHLWWNGWYWQVSELDNRRVDMRTHYKWRGIWGITE